MKTGWIIIEEYCRFHNISPEFITLLQEEGLITLETDNNTRYISEHELADLERFVRLHNELEVNVAGITIIHRMRKQLEDLQSDIAVLRRRVAKLQQIVHEYPLIDEEES